MFKLFKRKSEASYQFNHGMVFSGGGARGVAHAGALKALLEAGFHYEVFSGTSAGAIISILAAAKWSPSEMLAFISDKNLRSFSSFLLPKKGLLKLDNLGIMVKEAVGVSDLKDLPIPVRIHAVDLISGKVLSFEEGPIEKILTASCSIPGIFSPVDYEKYCLVDGGILNNLPVESIRSVTKHITAININPVISQENFSSILTILDRTFSLAIHANVEPSAAKADMLLNLEGVQEFGILDNSKSADIFALGYEYTQRFIEQLETENHS